MNIVQPTTAEPVPVIATRTSSHGRLVEPQPMPGADYTKPGNVVTWCGRTLTLPTQPFSFPLPGVASSVAAVSCKSCRRSRPGHWTWSR
jgi:hypothetical protein